MTYGHIHLYASIFNQKGMSYTAGIYILAISPPPIFCPMKNREEFEGGLHEKRKGKEKGDKTHVKIFYEA